MEISNKEQKKSALIAASLASFLTPFMGSSINVALPAIGSDFKANAILLSWIATSYLLASAVFLVPFGRVADIKGRKKVFILGIIIFTIFSFLCGTAGSVQQLIIFRIFQAAGSGMIFGTGMAILTSVFPAPERGKAFGLAVAAVYIGLSLGPSAGGILTEYFGWRSIFYLVTILGFLTTYIVIRKLKGEWKDAEGEKFDLTGSFLYGISLVLIMYGFPKLNNMTGLVIFLSGLLFLTTFIYWELRSDFPLLNLHLFRQNMIFRYSNLAALINYCATFAVAFLLSFYLQYAKGFSPKEAGFILVVQPIIMALFSPPAGRLSDRIDPGKVASIGMAISTFGLFLLVFISQDTSILFIIIILILLGVGFALFSSPNSNAIMSSVQKRDLGIASGTLGTMRLVGQMFSMGIVMMLFSLFIGQAEIGPENVGSLLISVKISFSIFAFLCFLGIFASLARQKR
ncbi:MAG: MFS transporter [Candidatus Aminicenantes bacterium]|nr:MFS transporter [Candidatus Aminicenantes bacterium]